MKKILIFVVFLPVILVILLTRKTDTPISFETKESNEGPVAVIVKPQTLENFEITLDTHSEELTTDLVAVSELVADGEKPYKPTNWEGSPPGGHHRSGILKFNPISPRPKSVELKINNVGGIERSFKWTF